MFISIILH